MKVLIVSSAFFPDIATGGGGARYPVALARALSKMTDTEYLAFGPKQTVHNEGDLITRIEKPLFLLRGQRSNPVTFSFLRLLRSVDVIHCFQFNSIVANLCQLAGMMTGKPVFLTDLAGGGFNLNSIFRLARFANACPSISEFSAHYMQDVHKVGQDCTPVIYAGVDVELFSPPSEDVQRKGVLYVGRLLPHKGVDVLIRAMPDEVPLKIVGHSWNDDYVLLLKKLARDKRVTFLQDLSDAALVEAYRDAAIFVLPSLPLSARPELFGLVVAEAMSCATPVIVSDSGSLPELIEAGIHGLIVEAGNVSALQGAISDLLSSPKCARRMGKAARERVVDNFTWSRVARACLQIYEDALGGCEQT